MNNEKQHIEKELQEISPLVKSMLQNRKQDIPAGYFEQLEKEILKKTSGSKKTKIISTRSWLVYVTSAAAVFSFIFFGVRLLHKENVLIVPFEEQIALLSSDEIETFISENIGEIETDLLFETEYISGELLDERYVKDVKEPMMQKEIQEKAEVEEAHAEPEENIFEGIDDATINALLNDETLFEDLGL